MLPELNFPPSCFRIKSVSGQQYIWDRLRGCWLRCTPEEWVRQHAISWLAGQNGVTPQRIVQEYPVALGSMAQRADIVLMDRQMHPLLLAECKAPDVKIDQTALQQAVRYNSVIGAKYIMLTNGKTHYFYQHEKHGNYSPLDCLPCLSEDE